MKRPALLCLAGSVFLAGNASAGINSPLDVTVVTQNAPTGRATLTYDIYFYGLSFMDSLFAAGTACMCGFRFKLQMP